MRKNDRVEQIDGQEIPHIVCFCYLGSIIHQDGETENNVIHRVLCNCRISMTLEGKFSKIVIRQAMLCSLQS